MLRQGPAPIRRDAVRTNRQDSKRSPDRMTSLCLGTWTRYVRDGEIDRAPPGFPSARVKVLPEGGTRGLPFWLTLAEHYPLVERMVKLPRSVHLGRVQRELDNERRALALLAHRIQPAPVLAHNAVAYA